MTFKYIETRTFTVAVENGGIESTKDITRYITLMADDAILARALFSAARRGQVEVFSHLLEKRSMMGF